MASGGCGKWGCWESPPPPPRGYFPKVMPTFPLISSDPVLKEAAANAAGPMATQTSLSPAPPTGSNPGATPMVGVSTKEETKLEPDIVQNGSQ